MSAEQNNYNQLQLAEIVSILNRISIFGGLTLKQIEYVITLLRSVHYNNGDSIFRHGDEPQHIYIVRSGEVKIIADIETEPLELVAFREGQCFGETALIGIQPHSADAVAVSAVELIVLSSDALLSIAEQDKELFSQLILNIAREACRRLHRTDEILLHYVHQKTSS